MPDLPDTRNSLLLKVSDSANAEAWREFAAIYRPAIYRLARRSGLQDADADDLAQRVLLVISRKIADWRPTSPHGAFRAWLKVVARNAIVNSVTRGAPDAGAGGSSTIARLGQQPARNAAGADVDDEFRRALFRRAADEIRPEFQEATWSAFWLTAVEGISIEDASQRLGRNAGSVYASRSRIMRRLREKVQEFGAWELNDQKVES